MDVKTPIRKLLKLKIYILMFLNYYKKKINKQSFIKFLSLSSKIQNYIKQIKNIIFKIKISINSQKLVKVVENANMSRITILNHCQKYNKTQLS